LPNSTLREEKEALLSEEGNCEEKFSALTHDRQLKRRD